MSGKITFKQGRASEIMIELTKGSLTTNRLVEALDKRGTYDGPVQRSNVCGYLRACREEGLVKTRPRQHKKFHLHSLTSKGSVYLDEMRAEVNALRT